MKLAEMLGIRSDDARVAGGALLGREGGCPADWTEGTGRPAKAGPVPEALSSSLPGLAGPIASMFQLPRRFLPCAPGRARTTHVSLRRWNAMHHPAVVPQLREEATSRSLSGVSAPSGVLTLARSLSLCILMGRSGKVLQASEPFAQEVTSRPVPVFSAWKAPPSVV